MDTPTPKARWIFSPGYDFAFFFLPPLLLLPLPWVQTHFFPGPGLPLWVMLVAFVHEGMMWALYSDPQRAAIHRNRWVYFFAAPAIILLVFCGVYLSGGVTWQVASILFVWWNFHHLIRQNVGIHILYRHRNQQGPSPWHERWAIYLVNWGCVVSQYYAGAFPSMPVISPGAAAIRYGAYGMIGCGALLAAMSLANRNTRPSGPAALFFGVALLFYVPFLYLHAHLMTAFAVSLLIHYIQYIGLLFGIQFNKFSGGGEIGLKRLVVYISVAALAWPLLRYLAQFDPIQIGVQSKAFTGIFAAWAGTSHYFLDRHVWRMAMPDIRAATVPYLRPLR